MEKGAGRKRELGNPPHHAISRGVNDVREEVTPAENQQHHMISRET